VLHFDWGAPALKADRFFRFRRQGQRCASERRRDEVGEQTAQGDDDGEQRLFEIVCSLDARPPFAGICFYNVTTKGICLGSCALFESAVGMHRGGTKEGRAPS